MITSALDCDVENQGQGVVSNRFKWRRCDYSDREEKMRYETRLGDRFREVIGKGDVSRIERYVSIKCASLSARVK